MIEKITFALMLVLSIALASHIYNDQAEEGQLMTHWKTGSQLVIEQDVESLKKRITVLEGELNISTD